MPSNIRSEYPPKPSNPSQGKGSVTNVVGSADPPVIRPSYEGAPSAPQQSKGSVDNVNK